jgi:hypothetical protein
MIFLIFQTIHLFKLTLSNQLQNYLSVFCKKVKTNCGGSIGAREEGHNKLLYYKAIPSTKNVSDFNPTETASCIVKMKT